MFKSFEYCVAFNYGVINWFKENNDDMGADGFTYYGEDDFPLLIPDDFEELLKTEDRVFDGIVASTKILNFLYKRARAEDNQEMAVWLDNAKVKIRMHAVTLLLPNQYIDYVRIVGEIEKV